MDWIKLTDESQVEEIISTSFAQPVVVFKHSTSCSISHMAKLRIESTWDLNLQCYFLDLLAHRPLSKYIAEKFYVYHESPQILLIDKGECIYDASHFDITVDELKEAIEFQEH